MESPRLAVIFCLENPIKTLARFLAKEKAGHFSLMIGG